MPVDAHTASDREFHDATAHMYDVTLEPIFGIYQELVVARVFDSLVGQAPGVSALDVGCGTGIVTVALARRGLRVRGVDHSSRMLERARARLAAEVPEADVELVQGDVRRLPVDDGEVDFLTCQGVLHHLEDIPGMLNEFARVLAPGGVFYLAEPCQGSNVALRTWERIRSRWVGLRGADDAAVEADAIEIPDHDEGPVNQDELLDALARAGLDARVEYWSRFEGLESLPAPVYGLALRLLTRPWRRRSGNLIFVTGCKPLKGA